MRLSGAVSSITKSLELEEAQGFFIPSHNPPLEKGDLGAFDLSPFNHSLSFNPKNLSSDILSLRERDTG